MGSDHRETALKLLNIWQKLATLESAAISEGNVQKLEELINQSTSIFQRLETIFSSGLMEYDKPTLETMKNLYELQNKNLIVLREQTDALSQEIGTLRKNKTSLMGYKQNKAIPPRFKNEHM
jgi:flagellin-specific chaperone FliS